MSRGSLHHPVGRQRLRSLVLFPLQLRSSSLLRAQEGEFEDSEPDPPIPPGLRTLSARLEALVDFLRIDRDLIAIAVTQSAALAPEGKRGHEFRRLITALSETEKTAPLVQVALGEHAAVGDALSCQYRAAHHSGPPTEPVRSIGELLAAASSLAAERRQKAMAHAARQQSIRDQRAAVAREKYLANWRRVSRRHGTASRNSWEPSSPPSTTRPCSSSATCAMLRAVQDVTVTWPRTSTTFGRDMPRSSVFSIISIARVCSARALEACDPDSGAASVVDPCTEAAQVVARARANGAQAGDESEKARQVGQCVARAMEGLPARIHRGVVRQALRQGATRRCPFERNWRTHAKRNDR
jgi:hypothetical protein